MNVERKYELEKEIENYVLESDMPSFGDFLENITSRQFLEKEEIKYIYLAYKLPLIYFKGVVDTNIFEKIFSKKVLVEDNNLKKAIESRINDAKEIDDYKKTITLKRKK